MVDTMHMRWHGGFNYADAMPDNPDAYETVDSVQDAVDTVEHRADGRDSYYPCAHAEGSGGAWIYAAGREPWNESDPYPDYVVEYVDGEWVATPA